MFSLSKLSLQYRAALLRSVLCAEEHLTFCSDSRLGRCLFGWSSLGSKIWGSGAVRGLVLCVVGFGLLAILLIKTLLFHLGKFPHSLGSLSQMLVLFW